jgi:two-component system cell cycle sensor histidine kinase/response regulator CckA
MQAVGQLAGGIAHDFNNMLTAIIGFSDFLLMNHRPTDPAFQDIMNIKQNANRAAGLVRQLLAFSRQQTLRLERLQLGDVLSELSILLGRLLGENIELKLESSGDLWPVKTDLNQFEQVIINLAVNARDAMPNGGRLTIRTANVDADAVRCFGQHRVEPGDYVMIEVIDNGTGMSAEIMGKIFEPFFSTKEVGRGSGLGLSTVYGIV